MIKLTRCFVEIMSLVTHVVYVSYTTNLQRMNLNTFLLTTN